MNSENTYLAKAFRAVHA